MANNAANFEAKVQAYFTTTLGRTATSTELATWSQKLADNNGNVWKSGLVATLAGDELTTITSGKTNAEIVSGMYKNLVGSTIPSTLVSYYEEKLDSGLIKVRGLANSLLNDLALMPKADGSFGQPANWGADLSTNISAEDSAAAQARVNFTILAASTYTTGNDTITGTAGADFLDGAAGNDSITGEAGTDKLIGGDGRDTIIGGRGLDYIDGGNGDDLLEATSYYTYTAKYNYSYYNNLGSYVPGYYTYTYDYEVFSETILGGAGADTIRGSYGSDYIEGGSGADNITGDYGSSLYYVQQQKPSAGSDTIYGGDGADYISANDGDNWVDGGTAADTIFAGSGNDTIYGGDADDYVNSNSGNDSIFGGIGNDTVYAGDGNDYVEGEIGADYLGGDSGDDTLLGGAGDDIIDSGNGSDSIVAGEGADIVYVSLGNDASDKVDLTDTDMAIDKVVLYGTSSYSPTQYDPVLVNGFDVNKDQLELNLSANVYGGSAAPSSGYQASYNYTTQQYDIVTQDYLQQVSSVTTAWLERYTSYSNTLTKDDYGKAYFAITGASAANNQLTTIASFLDPYGNNATYANQADHIFIFNIANINGTGVSGAGVYQFHDDTNADNVILGDELFPLVILVGVDAADVKATNFV